MDGEKKKLHFLLFPWLAQGHINPFLQLSKALAIHGHTVSFLSTPVNISRIKPSLQLHDWPGRIDLLELPLPPTEGLTPGSESTADIPIEMAFPFMKAMDGMEKPFRNLLQQLSPDYLVHDFVQYWTQSTAAEMGVPAIYFSIFAPVSCCYFLHPCKLRNHEITAEELAAPPLGFPSSAISFRLYEAQDFLLQRIEEYPGTLLQRIETFLSREQARELALGLEASGLPFLWSLRTPQFLDDPLEFPPDGFETRTRDRGLVVRGWMPQVRILSHPSVGGHLSQGGWSSVLEALSCGFPLILLPIRFDHGLNARQITTELKAGLEIERDDDGFFLAVKTYVKQ